MIQRIQTLYMVIVLLLNMAAVQFLALWTMADGTTVHPSDITWVMWSFYAVALLSLISVFLFRNRQNQFVLNRLNIILNFFLLGFFVYRSLNLSGGTEVSEKGIGMLIPVVSIVFLALANRAIKKDEDLVKSVDRLR